jgi:hypothetical protein
MPNRENIMDFVPLPAYRSRHCEPFESSLIPCILCMLITSKGTLAATARWDASDRPGCCGAMVQTNRRRQPSLVETMSADQASNSVTVPRQLVQWPLGRGRPPMMATGLQSRGREAGWRVSRLEPRQAMLPGDRLGRTQQWSIWYERRENQESRLQRAELS